MPDLRSLFFRLLAVVGVAVPPIDTPAQSTSVNSARVKNGYNLLHPTPSDLLRELSTDRPDKTESAFTVDAGHFQWEMDFAVYTHDRENKVRTRTWNIAPFNLKVGLTNNADLQLIFDDYIHLHTKVEPSRTAGTADGVGDLATRLKINLWGNDGGRTACAVMPFIRVPTNSFGAENDRVSSGVIFPLAVALSGGWDMGLQTEVDFVPNGRDLRYHAEAANSVTFSHELVAGLGGYVEFFSNVSTEREQTWVGTVDFGLTYALAKNIQLDAGCNVGITRAADDLQLFSGISLRF